MNDDIPLEEDHDTPHTSGQSNVEVSVPDFIKARKSQFTIFQSHHSEAEHQAMLRELASHQKELTASIEQQVQELEALLLQYDPLEVIAQVSYENSPESMETFYEPAHEGNDVYTEYVALLYLTRPDDTDTTSSKLPITSEVIQDIQNRIKKLFSSVLDEFFNKMIDPERSPGPPDSMTILRLESFGRSLVVRYPEYLAHLLNILLDLFSPLENELGSTLGFTINDALLIIQSIQTLGLRRLQERRKEAGQQAQELKAAVKKEISLR